MNKIRILFLLTLFGNGSHLIAKNTGLLPNNPISLVQSLGASTSDTTKAKSDTTKANKTKETVVTSAIENNNGKVTIQDTKIFDSTKQSELINITVLVRDLETNAPLTRVALKMKDAKTGKEFEPIFNPADQSFSIKVLPETIVRLYVTAKGYTDASANINDIKHDRRLAFELQKIKPSIVKITVLDLTGNRPIAVSRVKILSKSSSNDKTIVLDKGTTDLIYDSPDEIEVVATAPGYGTANKKLTVETALTGKRYELVIPLERLSTPTTTPTVETPLAASPTKVPEEKSLGTIEKGKVITLNNIYFDQSSPVLRTESSPQLDELVDILKQNPAVRIEIRGHTDNVGNFELNVKLSRDRCQSVVDYLIQKGIDSSRLQTLGRGPVDAVAPNTTEENRKKNRRVEFVVL